MSITEKSLHEMQRSISKAYFPENKLPDKQEEVTNQLKAWEELASARRLGEVAAIHQGIAYRTFLASEGKTLFADETRPGFTRGVRWVSRDFTPYEVKTCWYLNMDPALQQREATTLLDWSQEKVLVNAFPLSTPRWPLVAALDTEGLACTENFHAVWPTRRLPIEVLAILLNSPITHAWISQRHTDSSAIPIHLLNQIPIPDIDDYWVYKLTKFVHSYLSQREDRCLCSECADQGSGILGRIDEELLRLYNLSLAAERELLAYFDGYRRPGPHTQVKSSLTNRMCFTYVHVKDMINEGNEKILDVFIPCWRADDPEKIIQLPLSLIPAGIRDQVVPGSTLEARVNLGANDEKKLVFEDIELSPEIDEEEALAYLQRWSQRP